MITIDGSQGEGGGQVLRTSSALSLVTGHPFRMERVWAKRQEPGLLKQLLTAVEAAKAVGCPEVTGAALGSQNLEFTPGPVTPGNCRFAVGTAGSATLVLRTALPALSLSMNRIPGGAGGAPKLEGINRSVRLHILSVESEARLWVHGHMHCCCDYTLGKTRVLANPRGYPTQPRTGFNSGLIVEG